MDFKKYDKVKVSPEAAGFGCWLSGWVEDVSMFMGRTFVAVRYDCPAEDGSTGIVINNLGLLKKETDRDNNQTCNQNKTL